MFGYSNGAGNYNAGVWGGCATTSGYAGYFAGKLRTTNDLRVDKDALIKDNLTVEDNVLIEDNLTVEEIVYLKGITIGDYSNLQINTANGRVYYDNSSRRYKENIAELETNFSAMLDARPVQYIRPENPGRLEIGYIAEDMEALGLHHLVSLSKNGLVENFNYEKMILYVVEVLKDQQEEIASRDKQLADQQEAIETLQAQVAFLMSKD